VFSPASTGTEASSATARMRHHAGAPSGRNSGMRVCSLIDITRPSRTPAASASVSALARVLDRLAACIFERGRRIVIGEHDAAALVDAERHGEVEHLAHPLDITHAHGERVGDLVAHDARVPPRLRSG
jgi:hypothetical protein